MSSIAQNKLSSFIFILLFGWLLSFPFEGKVLAALTQPTEFGGNLLLLSIAAIGLGLLTSGFLSKVQGPAKISLALILLVCFLGSLVFYLPPSQLWPLALGVISALAGIFMGWWGFFYKKHSPPQERYKLAAEVLIYSALLMLLSDLITEFISPRFGLGFSASYLIVALLLLPKLEVNLEQQSLKQEKRIGGPLLVLCLFILIIAINVGFMYGVVTPAFAKLRPLANIYWALPYMAAILLLKRLAAKKNMAYLFYLALITSGISFLLFMFLNSSLASFLIIDTLMLAAFGISKLFWWSILGSFLEYTTNPAKVMGLGLSVNVLGILLGTCSRG